MLPYLLTAYFTFGPALLLATYLMDDMADEHPFEQVTVALALILVWPVMLALVAYAAWRDR